MRQTEAGCPIILVISGLKKGTIYVFRLFAYERGAFEGPGREEEYKTKGIVIGIGRVFWSNLDSRSRTKASVR